MRRTVMLVTAVLGLAVAGCQPTGSPRCDQFLAPIAVADSYGYAVNSDSTARKLTIEYGTITAPDGNIELTVAAESGLVLVVPGLLLTNSLVVTAFAATANVVLIGGFVNRIT